jgi:hypothetical protein
MEVSFTDYELSSTIAQKIQLIRVRHNIKVYVTHLWRESIEYFSHNNNLNIRIILVPQKLAHRTASNRVEEDTF